MGLLNVGDHQVPIRPSVFCHYAIKLCYVCFDNFEVTFRLFKVKLKVINSAFIHFLCCYYIIEPVTEAFESNLE